MQMPGAVAQVPVCWSVPRNTETILAAIAAAGAGTMVVSPRGQVLTGAAVVSGSVIHFLANLASRLR